MPSRTSYRTPQETHWSHPYCSLSSARHRGQTQYSAKLYFTLFPLIRDRKGFRVLPQRRFPRNAISSL